MPDSPYDALAADYHWLFSDEHVAGQSFVERYRSVLDLLAPGAEILDCSCGAGFEAVALARAGYHVTACDASPGMVEQARRQVAEAGVEVDVLVRTWEELPLTFAPRFDAVFCIGNSLAHASGREERLTALSGLHEVLVEGGVLVVESRDWETMRVERRRIEMRDRVSERDGVRGFCLYVWTIPEQWTEPHVAEIVVVLERGGSLSHHVVELSFSPFRKDELAGELGRAGFERCELVEDWPGRYFVTARKPKPAAAG